jgi:hypothetical protein
VYRRHVTCIFLQAVFTPAEYPAAAFNGLVFVTETKIIELRGFDGGTIKNSDV